LRRQSKRKWRSGSKYGCASRELVLQNMFEMRHGLITRTFPVAANAASPISVIGRFLGGLASVSRRFGVEAFGPTSLERDMARVQFDFGRGIPGGRERSEFRNYAAADGHNRLDWPKTRL